MCQLGFVRRTETLWNQAAIAPKDVCTYSLSCLRQLPPCDPVADDVILLSRELATNAIRHTASGLGGKFSVCVHVQDGWGRTEVHDLGSDTAPSVRRSGSPGESGAGLRVVETIADRWGFYGGRRCRVVWFEMGWQ